MNLFSAMTLGETTNVFLSKLVSSEVLNSNKADDEELEMAVFDFFRAFFMAPSARGRRRGRNPAEGRCRGSERLLRIGEEMGRRHSARLDTLLVRQPPRSSTTKPKGGGGQYTAMISLLLESGNHPTSWDKNWLKLL